MEKSVTISMSVTEFKDLIRESIAERASLKFDFQNSDEEMNQKEASKFLGISQTTIIKWKKDGKIPFEQVPGSSKVRFYKSQLKKAIQQNPHLLQAARN